MMTKPSVGILHYTTPPVIGGVEAVIHAHVRLLTRHNYPVTVITGRGEAAATGSEASLVLIPEIDSQNVAVLQMKPALERGKVPEAFDGQVQLLASALRPVVTGLDHLIIHNVFTKHFNLALTVALRNLVEDGAIRHAIAWCHDISWTSANSRPKLHSGFPWNVLRTYNERITYVAVSARRQKSLADLFGCSPSVIHLVYNGVETASLLGLSQEGQALAERLQLETTDLILLMPVRVTRAKNIEYAFEVVAALKEHLNPKLLVTGPPDPHDPESMDYFRSLQEIRDKLGIENEAHFIFESGPDPSEPYLIDQEIVGDFYRMCDVMFMPSHREGFGMPVLEAGLAGVPVVCTDVPAAHEIGGKDVAIFSGMQPASDTARLILERVEKSPVARFRRCVRQGYTWEALFRDKIEPLLASPHSP